MRAFTLLATLLGLTGAVQGATISKNARCGVAFGGTTCLGSTYGSCCSQYNFCGSTTDYCAPSKGCQSKFGTCTGQAPDNVAKVSANGKCGGSSGQTCQNSVFGNCCSQYGYCGRSDAYCLPSKGCQSKYGTCDTTSMSSTRLTTTSSSTTRSTSASASPTQAVSRNARCGAAFGGQTCQGSRYGNCCSQYFYCGSTDDYCRPQSCQKGYGLCNAAGGSSSSSSVTVSSIMSSSSSSSSQVSSSATSSTTSSSAATSTIEASSSSASSSAVEVTPSLTTSQIQSSASQTTAPPTTSSSSSCAVSNLIANPSFEGGSDGWTLSDAAHAYDVGVKETGGFQSSSYYSLTRLDKSFSGTIGTSIEHTFALDVETKVQISAQIRVLGATTDRIQFRVYVDRAGGFVDFTLYGGVNWFRWVAGAKTFSAGSHTLLIQMAERSPGSAGMEIGLDAISVQAVTDVACATATLSSSVATLESMTSESTTSESTTSESTTSQSSSTSPSSTSTIESTTTVEVAPPSSPISSTSSAAATPTCTPTQAAVVNPGFEDNTLLPWTFYGTNINTASSGVYPAPGSGFNFVAQASQSGAPWTFTLSQDVQLTPGTSYIVNVRFDKSGGANECNIRIMLDTAFLGGYQIGAPFGGNTFPGPGVGLPYFWYTGSVGKLQFVVNCRNGAIGQQEAVSIDDVTFTSICPLQLSAEEGSE